MKQKVGSRYKMKHMETQKKRSVFHKKDDVGGRVNVTKDEKVVLQKS